MLPTLDLWTAGRPVLERVGFLLAPGPLLFEQPLLKLLLWLTHSFLGAPYGGLLLLGAALHAAGAALVVRVGRQLGLDRPAACLAGAIHGVSFAHFHAYGWPAALQHTAAIATVLALLSLYLQVESMFQQGHPRRNSLLYGTWGLALLGSLQRSTLLFPAVIGMEILFGSATARERAERFRRWMPLFFISPLYTLGGLIFVGDLVLSTALHQSPIPPAWKAAAVLSGLCGALLLLQALLERLVRFPESGKALRWIALGALLLLATALAVRDHRQLLLPYNAWVPWWTLFGFFLDPLRAARATDSTLAYHVLPPALNLFTLALSLLSVWLFWRREDPLRPRARWILGAWYVVCLWYLLLHKHVVSSFPIQIPSRYFLYLSPLFAWIAAELASRLCARIAAALRLSPWRRAGLAWALLLAFTLPNVCAVRLQLFRGKLTNSYFAYDDVRTADLIRQDLVRRQRLSRPGVLAVSGVEPLRFGDAWNTYVPTDAIALVNARRFLEERLTAGWRVEVNPPAGSPSVSGYRVEGARILNGEGEPVEPFWISWERGAFREAVEERPYLLNYLLGRNRWSDVRWITNGRALREWVRQIEGRWRRMGVVPLGKWERTRAVMEAELSAYAGCLVGLSAEAAEAGREEEARRWMWQLHLLEPDGGRLQEWLMGQEWMRDRPQWQRHLERVREPRWFQDPLPWTKDDYGFGRFLLRLLLNIDVQSRWDRRWGVAGV